MTPSAIEEDRQDALQAMFDELSDEEPAHWKGVAVAEFPTLIQNPQSCRPARERPR